MKGRITEVRRQGRPGLQAQLHTACPFRTCAAQVRAAGQSSEEEERNRPFRGPPALCGCHPWPTRRNLRATFQMQTRSRSRLGNPGCRSSAANRAARTRDPPNGAAAPRKRGHERGQARPRSSVSTVRISAFPLLLHRLTPPL